MMPKCNTIARLMVSGGNTIVRSAGWHALRLCEGRGVSWHQDHALRGPRACHPEFMPAGLVNCPFVRRTISAVRAHGVHGVGCPMHAS